MAQMHTQEEYGKLLKAALEKMGFRVGLWIHAERAARGVEDWAGFLEIRRAKERKQDFEVFYPLMIDEASIYIGMNGRIELLYREKIVVNPARKAAEDAAEAEYLAYLEEDEKNRHLMDEFEYEAWTAEQGAAAAPYEDFNVLTEQDELRMLRALNKAGCRLTMPMMRNETYLEFVDEYWISSCSCAGAKKAAEWVHEKLWNVCCEIAKLEESLGFKRVRREREASGWLSESVVDEFDQVHGYIAELQKKYAQEQLCGSDFRIPCEDEWEDDWEADE